MFIPQLVNVMTFLDKNVRVHETTTTASAQAVLPTSPMVPLHGNDDNDDSDAKQHVINHDTATTGDEIKQDADQDADHSSDNSINHDIGNGMEHGVDHDMDHDSDYNLDTDTDNGLNHTTGHDSEDDDDDDDDDNDMNHDIDHNAKDGDIDHDTGDDNNDHSITDHDIHHHPFNGTTDPDQQDDDDDHIPANTTISKNKSGLTVMLKDDKNFCIFLPSSPGNRDENNGKNDPSAISDSEKSARVFCTSKSSQHAVPGGKSMPKGFIKSAKFASDKSRQFVQVTGSIDRDAYALSPKDGGGQVQISIAFSHSSCHWWTFYTTPWIVR